MAKRPPAVREMYTVFEEVLTVAAKRFRRERPEPSKCQAMLQALLITLRGYEEAIGDLISQQRSNARHHALPIGYPLRRTRESRVE